MCALPRNIRFAFELSYVVPPRYVCETTPPCCRRRKADEMWGKENFLPPGVVPKIFSLPQSRQDKDPPALPFLLPRVLFFCFYFKRSGPNPHPKLSDSFPKHFRFSLLVCPTLMLFSSPPLLIRGVFVFRSPPCFPSRRRCFSP